MIKILPKMRREKKRKKKFKSPYKYIFSSFSARFYIYCIQLYYEGTVKISDKKMDPNRSYD